MERNVTTVGLLHTVPALAATFDRLVDDAAPGLRRVHTVDGWLLATARRDGITPDVQRAVQTHLQQLAAIGADAVLVTCSSIGEAAEAAASAVTIPVVRVDTAMSEQAVQHASAAGARGRIAVLATLTSTLGPTGRLVERAARAAGCNIDVTADIVDGAAEAADAGDCARVDALVAAAVQRAGIRADVIVLAQASMAGAAQSTDVGALVLSSPIGGVRALLAELPPGHVT